MAVGNAPAAASGSGYDLDREMLVRELLGSTAWALATAIRTSLRLNASSDPIPFINMALKQSGLAYRLEAVN